ncbi:MAG: acetate--CoA ligase family protein, partial [Actinomycetota bacterium]
VGVESASEVRAAYDELLRKAKKADRKARIDGVMVCEMVTGGVEMLVGVAHDRLFGPVIACSAGGTAVELVRDVSVSITPITDRDAAEMVRSLKTYPLLTGFRGAPPADVPALENVLLRVGALVEAHPAIAEMDCNPVMVLPEGACVVDARIRVEDTPPDRPLAARGKD